MELICVISADAEMPGATLGHALNRYISAVALFHHPCAVAPAATLSSVMNLLPPVPIGLGVPPEGPNRDIYHRSAGVLDGVMELPLLGVVVNDIAHPCYLSRCVDAGSNNRPSLQAVYLGIGIIPNH